MNKIMILLISCMLYGCSPTCYKDKMVVEVGGCNSSGECSVIYDDGTVERYVKQPVKTEIRSVKVECGK